MCLNALTPAPCQQMYERSASTSPCLSHACSHVQGEYETFVVIGDFGLSYAGCEEQVSNLVGALEQQLSPARGLDFIFSTGDNNYWNGACETVRACKPVGLAHAAQRCQVPNSPASSLSVE